VIRRRSFDAVVCVVAVNKRAAKADVKATGKVNNNAAMKWQANQAHGIQVHEIGDISGGICGNVGDVFATWGDALTDSDANLVVDFTIEDDGTNNVAASNLAGRSLVIQRNASSVEASANAIVACCVITLDEGVTPQWTAAPPATTPAAVAAAWPYAWPQGWAPPAGCS
jgi:hypothetical protein